MTTLKFERASLDLLPPAQFAELADRMYCTNYINAPRRTEKECKDYVWSQMIMSGQFDQFHTMDPRLRERMVIVEIPKYM